MHRIVTQHTHTSIRINRRMPSTCTRKYEHTKQSTTQKEAAEAERNNEDDSASPPSFKENGDPPPYTTAAGSTYSPRTLRTLPGRRPYWLRVSSSASSQSTSSVAFVCRVAAVVAGVAGGRAVLFFGCGLDVVWLEGCVWVWWFVCGGWVVWLWEGVGGPASYQLLCTPFSSTMSASSCCCCCCFFFCRLCRLLSQRLTAVTYNPNGIKKLTIPLNNKLLHTNKLAKKVTGCKDKRQ